MCIHHIFLGCVVNKNNVIPAPLPWPAGCFVSFNPSCGRAFCIRMFCVPDIL